MTREQARYQALAASGGALVAFIGAVHETVGPRIFPWGPALFGGPIGWHAVGVACIVLGVALFAGALRLIRFRLVVPVSIVLAVGSLAATVYTAVVRADFHVFALTLAIAGAVIAWCHPRSLAD